MNLEMVVKLGETDNMDKGQTLGWWLRMEEGASETEVLEIMAASPLR